MGIVRHKNYKIPKDYNKLIINYHVNFFLGIYYFIGVICFLYYVINCYN